MPTISKQLTQAYQMQDLAFNVAMALKADITEAETGKVKIVRDEYGKPVDAPAIAQLIKAWESAQQRISFHRRVPSPGSLKPVAGEGRRRRRAPIVPLADSPTQAVVTGTAS